MNTMTKMMLAATALTAVAPASAATIVVGQWYDFAALTTGFTDGSLSTNGTNPDSIDAPTGPWTFTLGAFGGTVTFVDGFTVGERFAITDFGNAIGTTSAPAAAGTAAGCGSNITACLASPNNSKGVFNLAAGNHSISGSLVAGTNTGAFFRVDEAVSAAVPETATWAMMIAGFGMMGAAMRTRRRSTKVSFA